MWAPLLPWRSEEEIPIGHITNGVHVPSWLAQQIRVLYNRVLPLDWYVRTGEPTVWAGFENVTPGELWETHNSLKNRLIQFVRYRTDRVAKANGGSPQHETDISNLLDPNALTIGFARRFAPYKRADLVMRDLENFRRVLTDVNRPVQIIYAGKAHPRDDLGKEVMRNIIKLTGDESLAGRVVFVENYDINVARHLIQGVDVWLNNPRRPLEASGTSGQKLVLNAGLNLSVLDGWWCEGYDGKNGFAIGGGQTHVDPSVQDQRDAEDLVRVLNEEVIPIYYDRDHDDIPQAWVKMMKRSVRTLGWRFNADRMVMDYTQNAYVPAAGGMSCVMPPAM